MRPIVNKYREGKVGSTPSRGVKQTLKPCAYEVNREDAGSRSESEPEEGA